MIEMGKKYQTRDGRPVRILCVDGPNVVWPIVGYIGDSHVVSYWTLNGSHGSDTGLDLVPAPVKREGWAVVGKKSFFFPCLFSTREQAEIAITGSKVLGPLALAHVTWEE